MDEWFEDDPHASSIVLIQHFLNLDELDTIEWWVKLGCTAGERAEIDRYYLQLLSTHTSTQPLPSIALLATAQTI